MIPSIFFALLLVLSPIQRVPRADGVHVVYVIVGDAQPRITVTHGAISGVTSVQDGTTWRTTVAARLDVCDGALLVDDTVVTQQRCAWLPQTARNSQ